MTTQTERTIKVPFKTGTTAQNNTYLGGPGEITIDRTKRSIRVHDGVTVGGEEILRKTDLYLIQPLLDTAYEALDEALDAASGVAANTTAAANSESNALAYSNLANGSKLAAAASAAAAAISATAASGAEGFKNQAATSATAAAASATAAGLSQQGSYNSAVAAEESEQLSLGYQTTSAGSAASALASKIAAEASKVAAGISDVNSGVSANASEAAREAIEEIVQLLGDITSNTFSGTDAQTVFTLSISPASKNNTQVHVNGMYQLKSSYSLSGTTLTFTEAPPLGTSNIEVVISKDLTSLLGVMFVDTFSGNDVTTTFTLSADSDSDNNAQVHIGGAGYQYKNSYTIVDNTITFSEAPPTGTNNIEVMIVGPGPIATRLRSKLRDAGYVTGWGVTGNGTTNEVARLSQACQQAPSVIPTQAVNEVYGIPNAEVVTLRLPAGHYNVPTMVDTGGREAIWILETGAIITGGNTDNLQGKVIFPGQKTLSRMHYGTREYACTYSFISNNNLGDSPPVLGYTHPNQLALYADRDSVGLYAQNGTVSLVGTYANASFTSTTVTGTVPIDVKLLRKGMIIDTAHEPKYSGMVNGWTPDGLTIQVTAWYRVNGSTTAVTPSNGVAAYINSVTKIWVANFNLMMYPGRATSGTGCELGVFNFYGNPSGEGAIPLIWGYDAVNLWTNKCESAFIARAAAGSWYKGFETINNDVGFQNVGNGVAFKNKGEGAILQSYLTNGSANYLISSTGSVEAGPENISGPVYIDFRTSGVTVDYDSRILATGGTSTTGSGTLTFNAGSVQTPQINPGQDNVYSCGTSLKRFSLVYSGSGVTTTSDRNQKKDIETIDLEAALKVLESVDAKSFRRIDDEVAATVDKRLVTRQVTRKVPGQKKIEVLTVVDGQAVQTFEMVDCEVEELVFIDYPVVNEEGNPVYEKAGRDLIQPRVHKVPVMETVEEVTEIFPSFSKESVRRHWGFIAQEMEDAFLAAGITTTDFAGITIDKQSGAYGLRYEQVFTVLWPVVQNLVSRVKDLEETIVELRGV